MYPIRAKAFDCLNLRKSPFKIPLYLLCILLIISSSACGIKYDVKGNVIDAQTGAPIEGAAIAIKWVHYRVGPPGLPTPKTRLGTTETLSDENGVFIIPKYSFRSHYMGVYKKGYICWSSEKIFNPTGKTYEEMNVNRTTHRVTNGMKIRLEPFSKDYPRDKHARFAVNTATNCGAGSAGLFGMAIELESHFLDKILEKKE